MKEQIMAQLEKVTNEKYLQYIYELLLTFNEDEVKKC